MPEKSGGARKEIQIPGIKQEEEQTNHRARNIALKNFSASIRMGYAQMFGRA